MSSPVSQHVKCHVQGDVIVFSISARHLRDAPTSYGLRDAMLTQWEAASPRHVAVDFQDVDFVGSIGFLALLSLRRQLQEGRIILCNMRPNVRDAFRACRLLAADPDQPAPFEETNTLEEALVSCATDHTAE